MIDLAPTIPGAAPKQARATRFIRRLALLGACGALAGCKMVIIDPSGDVALQQRNLIFAATALMLLVIVPVIIATFVFARRYRASNPEAAYEPDWAHSTQLEVVIWTVPLLIIMAIGAMTWIGTHTLDPYRPLSRLGPNRPIPAGVQPLEVQAVALDWKWLFIYPELGVATVNELAAPVDRPITFRITSSSVWNTLSIPAIAGMIYAMPGMQTQLNAVANREGEFRGLSGHYSGSGFSRMNFAFRSLSAHGFDDWVQKAKASQDTLDRNAYLELDKPSEGNPVRYYGTVEKGLFDAILGMCVRPGQMCIGEMHHLDRRGGNAADSEANRKRLQYDNRRLPSGSQQSESTSDGAGGKLAPAQSPTSPAGHRH
ncbi:ubiquinol oxidase subunit II [Reyranella sp.]|uniref:ubiquinol oxidase subunit II n=1 Tax=Reyranella sp. TaxID=1929291 RepID=UPI003D0EE52D